MFHNRFTCTTRSLRFISFFSIFLFFVRHTMPDSRTLHDGPGDSRLRPLLFLLIYLKTSSVLASFDFSSYPDCGQRNASDPFVSLPVLADQFLLRLEMKSNQQVLDGKQTVREADLYYDKGRQQMATTGRYAGHKDTIIFDLERKQIYRIEDDMCATQLRDEALLYTICDPFIVFMVGRSNQAAFNCSLESGNVIYRGDRAVGNDPLLVRDIHVRRWTQCVFERDRYRLTVNDYYFNADTIESPSGESIVPVRLTSRQIPIPGTPNPFGIHIEPSITTADFTYYRPSIADKSVFLPPSGVFCANWTKDQKTMPQIPDAVSMSLLTASEISQELHKLKILFNYKHGLVAFTADYVNGSSYPPKFSDDFKYKNRYHTVHDYSSGLSFVQPLNNYGTSGTAGCTITPISNTSLDSQATSAGVTLRHANELFGLNRTGWVYIGQRNFASIPSDVYSLQDVNLIDNSSTVNEVYWSQDKWTHKPAITGFVLHRKHQNRTAIETLRTTVSSYTPYPSDYIRIFDISGCLKSDQPINVAFDIRLENYTAIDTSSRSRNEAFTTSLSSILSKLLSTSALRLWETRLFQDSSDAQKARIWMTIHEWPNITGKLSAPVEKPAIEVAKDLEKMLTGADLLLDLEIADTNQIVTILRNTVTFGTDILRPTSSKSLNSATGYSSGSMAGLAVAMLTIGCAAGLAGGFMKWKRGIAYFDLRRRHSDS